MLTAVAIAVAAIAASATPASAKNLEPMVSADDGWFEAREIDSRTWALAEPKSSQKNISYFIAGEKRAILFDAGSGEDDITFIASRIIDRPVTVLPSHAHFDHTGSIADFESVAMADIPVNRAQMHEGRFQAPISMSLTWPNPGWKVSEWWPPGTKVNLGRRTIEVVHIPGHSPDSIALVDRARGQMFVGDHIYPGAIVAFTPGANLEDYLASTQRLRSDYPEVKVLYCAHDAAAMPVGALAELEEALKAIIEHKAAGHRLWRYGWMVSEYPFASFSVLASPSP